MRRPYVELNAPNDNDARAPDSPVRWINFPSFFDDTPALLHPDFVIVEPSGLR